MSLKLPIPVLLCILIAFATRLYSINGNIYHPDEPIVVNKALSYASGDFNPHFFKIPPLSSYILFLIYGVFYVLAKCSGQIMSAGDFLRLYIEKPEIFYVIGRFFLGVALGTFQCFLLYRLSRRYFGELVAMTAALFLALNYLHVRDSHYIYTDMGTGCCVMSIVLLSIQLLNGFDKKKWFLIAFLCGLATAFKYNAALAVMSPLAAICISPVRVKIKSITQLCIIAVTSFFVFNPYALIDFHTFYSEVHGQAGAEGFTGYFHHMVVSLAGALSYPMLIMAVLGVVWMFAKKTQAALIISAFVLSFWTHLIFLSQHHERYVLFTVPFFCLFAACAVVRLGQNKRWIGIMLILSVIVLPLFKILQYNLLMSELDNRGKMKLWIESNLPQGSNIAFSHSLNRPMLARTALQMKEIIQSSSGLKKYRSEALSRWYDTKKSYNLFFIRDRQSEGAFSLDSPIVASSYEALQKADIQYVVLDYENAPQNTQLYNQIKTRARLICRYSPYLDQAKNYSLDIFAVTAGPLSARELFSRHRLGPVLEVYKL